MKRILVSLLLVLSLIMSSICYVGAASLDDIWAEHEGRAVAVDVTITANGLESVTGYSGTALSFKAVLDMIDVNLAVGLISTKIDNPETIGVTGTITITAEWNGVNAPNTSSLEVKDLSGFTFKKNNVEVDGADFFNEPSLRTVVDNKVTATIKVNDNITVSELSNLPDEIILEQDGFSILSDGKIKGTINVDIKIGDKTVPCRSTVNEVSITRRSSGGGSSTSSSTVTNPDGSTTTTTTNKNTGTVTETTKNPDGSSEVVETKKDGTTTTTEKDTEGNTTTTVEKPNGDKTTTETNKDGSEKVTEEKADGTTTTTEKDVEGNTTTTVETPEGDKTTTETNKDGSEKVTEEKADGTTTTTEKDAEGNTSTKVETPEGNVTTEQTNANGTTVKTETPKNGDTTAEVTVPENKETEVKIPVERINSVSEVVITDKDGNKTVVEDYVENEADGSITIKVDQDVKVSVGIKFKEFDDVHPLGHWAESVVDFVYAKDLMNGVSASHFEPDHSITRGMFVTILYRLEGEPETEAEHTFNDIEANSYYEKAVAWGAKNIIIKGYNEHQYAPYEIITREQMAAIIHRYVAYLEAHHIVHEETDHDGYDDEHHISDYAKDAVRWNSEQGFLKGDGDGTFRPQDDATRAEAATIIKRLYKALGL